MTRFLSTHRTGFDQTSRSADIGFATTKIVEQVRQEWEETQAPDLPSLLRDNPDLCGERSAVIELAVAEYRILRRKGIQSDIQAYCSPFRPFGNTLYSSIFRQLEVERFFDDHPSLRIADELADWPAVDDTIGGYEIVEELGRGALAHVYLCLQHDLGDRQVVVKVSRSGMQEGKTLGKLQHSNIMPVHTVEVANDAGLSYLCTPFLGRSTLHNVIGFAFAEGIPRSAEALLQGAQLWITSTDRMPRDPAHRLLRGNSSYVNGVVYLAAKLADALAHAHSVGILHGDIKPSNILVTPGGEPVLLDFNLARDYAHSVTLRGGTLPYMAPEVLLQMRSNEESSHLSCDARSEVFSLGVVLYESLAGCLPFEVGGGPTADIDRDMLRRHEAGPQSLRAKNPHVGDSLARVIHRCLAFNPQDRYESMTALRTALQRELELPRRSVRWVQCNRRKTLLIAVLSIVISASLGWWLITRPAYHVRAYAAGLQYYSEGQFEKAAASFENARNANRQFLDARHALAHAYLALGRREEATEEFLKLAGQFHHPPSMASAAYCANLNADFSAAIAWYNKALESGFDSGGLRNNLAVSYELGRSAASRQERSDLIETHLEQARIMLPNSATVQYNIAINELRKFDDDISYVPLKGLEQIKKVSENGVYDCGVRLVAARLYGAIARVDATVVPEAIEVFKQVATACGETPYSLIVSDPSFKPLVSDPRFVEAMQSMRKVPRSKSGKRLSRLINPAPWPAS